MPVYKNKNGNGWYAMMRYTDWQGNKKQKCQRGFATRREAQDFEAQFILKKKADINMTLESFCELYAADIRPRIKETTWITNENIIRTKIVPYLGKRRLCEITPNGEGYRGLAERDHDAGRSSWQADLADLSENDPCATLGDLQSRDPLL